MAKYSEELTRHEIEDSIDASEKLLGVIDYVNAMNYRKEIREFWHSLPSITVKNGFSEDEVDVISAALRRREFELSAKSIGKGAIKPWSSSDNIPPEREADWRERQLPPSDRI